MLFFTVVFIIHLLLTITALYYYRKECIMMDNRPEFAMIIFTFFPLVNLFQIEDSLKRITVAKNKKVRSFAEVILNIKQEDYDKYK